MRVQHNLTTFLRELDTHISNNNLDYDISQVTAYEGTQSKVSLHCNRHNHSFEQSVQSILYSNRGGRPRVGCQYCSGKVAHVDDFIAKAKSIHADFYDYSQVDLSGGTNSNLTIVCPLHGEFTQRGDSHLQGSRCPQCVNAEKSYDKYTWLQEVAARNPHYSNIDYSQAVYAVGKPITLLCKVCGHQWQVQASSHVCDGTGCPECGRESTARHLRLPWEEFVQRGKSTFKLKDGSPQFRYKRPEQWLGSKRTPYVDLFCRLHNVKCKTGVDAHLRGATACPKCAQLQVSRPHRAICGVLDSLGIKYVINDRKVLGGLELDIWVPQHKLGIEINGLYFHRSLEDCSVNRHSNKYKLACKKGITLLQFWDTEVQSQLGVIKSMLKHRLGMSKRIYARQCVVQEISASDAGAFLNLNHMQGKVGAKVRLGLYYKGRLAGVGLFSPPKFNPHADWELLRWCNHRNISVVGGASKVLAHFVEHYKPELIVSYSDNRYTDGNLYSTIGFELDSCTRSDYVYVCPTTGTQVSRAKARRTQLAQWLDSFDPSLSEYANMTQAGFYKLKDCGRKVWYYKP